MTLHILKESTYGQVAETKAHKGVMEMRSGMKGREVVLAVCLVVAVLLCASLSAAAPSRNSSHGFLVSGIAAEPVVQATAHHADLIAAGFGFQAAGSSMITVRTYDAPTGAILSEDSFDVNVKEERAAPHDEHKGRIFAGGIGIDSKEKSKFMVRVYDAETGRFLWEGQLNLLKLGEGGTTRASATIVPNRSSAIQTAASGQEPMQTLFSVRAVNPITGGLVWQDQFSPGIRKRAKVEGVSFDGPRMRAASGPIGPIFDLVVQTYDRASGRLLWEDSFEQLDRIEEPEGEPETNAHPQAIPFWRPTAEGLPELYQTGLR